MSDEFKYCNLNDYVSREALYIEFRRHFTAPENWRKLAKFVIDATPSADVAPNITHCKNCKYFFSELGGDYGSCTRIQGGDVVKANDFCSRAKRKDGVNNDKKTSN